MTKSPVNHSRLQGILSVSEISLPATVMFLVIFFHPFEQHFTQAVNEVGSFVRLSPAYPCVVARGVLHVYAQQPTHVFHYTFQRDIAVVEQLQFMAGVQ